MNDHVIKDLSPAELVDLYYVTYEEMQKYWQDNHGKWMY